MSKPKIICFCGSMIRAEKAFEDAEFNCAMAGNIGLFPVKSVQAMRGFMTQEQFKTIKELHFRKIEMADQVVVLNEGGYIGEWTRDEINYARHLGKEIHFLEKEVSNG